MDITTRLLFGSWHWSDQERRLSILLCGLVALISATTLAGAITLYHQRLASSELEQQIGLFPHLNNFSAGYQATPGYDNCRTQMSATHGDCADGCDNPAAQPSEAAGITWLVLECQQAESSLYTEFAQELFHGMGSGLSIEIIKPNWSF
nr:hypothetical protein [uncultured Pseudomonas sp.]